MGEVSGRWFGYQDETDPGDFVTSIDGRRLLVDRILMGGHDLAMRSHGTTTPLLRRS
nr:hypothetical protein JVH1_1092 [Rhodococcus sp. JVH1]